MQKMACKRWRGFSLLTMAALCLSFAPAVPVLADASATCGTTPNDDYVEIERTLRDRDGDGVSDFNEALFRTSPRNENSVPDPAVLDVLALYTEEVDAIYNNEPVARILHYLEWANNALHNSQVDARFRLVGREEAGPQPPLVWHPSRHLASHGLPEGAFQGYQCRTAGRRGRPAGDLCILQHWQVQRPWHRHTQWPR